MHLKRIEIAAAEAKCIQRKEQDLIQITSESLTPAFRYLI